MQESTGRKGGHEKQEIEWQMSNNLIFSYLQSFRLWRYQTLLYSGEDNKVSSPKGGEKESLKGELEVLWQKN